MRGGYNKNTFESFIIQLPIESLVGLLLAARDSVRAFILIRYDYFWLLCTDLYLIWRSNWFCLQLITYKCSLKLISFRITIMHRSRHRTRSKLKNRQIKSKIKKINRTCAHRSLFIVPIIFVHCTYVITSTTYIVFNKRRKWLWSPTNFFVSRFCYRFKPCPSLRRRRGYAQAGLDRPTTILVLNCVGPTNQ